MAGVGVLQHGDDHMVVQPPVKRRVECGFLKPPYALEKSPAFFQVQGKQGAVYSVPFLDVGHQCNLKSSLLF